MSTYFRTKEEAETSGQWWVVDATAVPVGRLASKVATVIRGKHKPNFTPHVNGGDFVVVINADKIKLTGNKEEDKLYRHHTGYIGGLKEIKASKMRSDAPERIIERAVTGMLPGGVLGHRMIKKLKVYTGSEHPHVAQMPKQLEITK